MVPVRLYPWGASTLLALGEAPLFVYFFETQGLRTLDFSGKMIRILAGVRRSCPACGGRSKVADSESFVS